MEVDRENLAWDIYQILIEHFEQFIKDDYIDGVADRIINLIPVGTIITGEVHE